MGRFNGEPVVQVFARGRFDDAMLMDKLEGLPGVERVIVPLPFGLAGPPSACVFRREDVHHYILAHARLERTEIFVDRWAFEADDAGVRLVETWTGRSDETPPPVFIQDECLRKTTF